jgi:S1-C subfamily serine protease
VDALDVALVVVVLLSTVHGSRTGAAAQLASLVGFCAGLAAGAGLVTLVDPHVVGQLAKTFTALALLLLPAGVGGHLGRRLGTSAWSRLRRARLGALDAALGAVVAAAGTLVLCWLLASILVNSAIQAVVGQIERSVVLRSVAGALPPVPSAFASVERYLAAGGFPQVLANVVPEPVGPVALARPATVRAAVAAASASTVKVVAIGCGDEQEGSGFVAVAGPGHDLVVTNAHVVAGTGSISVEAPDGTTSTATPVLFDPRFDLAVLRSAPLGEPALGIDRGLVERGAPAVVLGYPGGGPLTDRAAGVLARFEAEGRDIYGNALTVRTVYELRAVIRPGNSGGPLVASSGEVLGVVFSRSTSDPDIGYALASPGVASRVVEAMGRTAAVSTDGCVG